MHTAERFRTTQDMYVGGNLSVAGNFNVTGNVYSTSTTNLSVSDNLIYLASGDTIPASGITYTGTHLNDLSFRGVFEGSSSTTYYVKITSVGGSYDTFSWSKDNFATTIASGIHLPTTPYLLDNGISVQFNSDISHELNDIWYATAAPINIDIGLVGNYNDGTYKHTGLFRDASDGVYKFFQGYTPEPQDAVNINTSHASFGLASLAIRDLTANNINISGNTQTHHIIPVSDITYDLGTPARRFRTLYISGSTIALGSANLTSTGSTLSVGGKVLVTNGHLTSSYIANTTARILISDRLQVANAALIYQTKVTERGALANTNAFIKSQLANTNSYILTKASWSALAGTNTAIRTLVSDRYQVANVNTLLNAKATWTGLTGTNTAIRALVSDRYQVANVNTLLAAKATWAGLTATNTAIRALDAQKLQVANATTLLLAKASWAGLTGTNTEIRTLISDRLQVANAVATYQTKAIERAALANTNSYIGTKVNITTFNLALANTNAAIAAAGGGGGGGASWSALTTTNTALRLLISDRLQVANAATTYQTKATERAALANTNAFIKSQLANTNLRVALLNTNLTGTNTAIRALDTAKLSVANAVSTYATKIAPTTSGLHAHTGRATISTNLAVTGNTTITGTLIHLSNNVTVVTNAGTVSTSYRTSTFTNSSAASMSVTMSTTGAIDGQMIMVRIYDFSAAAQSISWINTENSLVSVPTTSGGSTTLPSTVGFQYNGQTSKWRCIAVS